jgi:hypothetical protein
METNNLIQVLLYFIPAALVLGACYLMVQKSFDNEQKIRLLELKKGNQKDTLPLCLQAYERIIVFLERISPNNLLLRTNRIGMSSRDLHSDLLTTIRAEYDHNISQQLYVSPRAWQMVNTAKEDMVKLINLSVAQAGANKTSIELSKQIYETMNKIEVDSTQKAIDFMKLEAKQLFL